jgi:hypothetical protein
MGTLNTTFGPVSMIDNGVDLTIADGTNIYQMLLSTNVLTVVTDSEAPDTTPILDFVDGYIFAFDPASTDLGSFQHSMLKDASSWQTSDILLAEGSPDRVVSLIVNNQEVWVFGSKSYEIYYNTQQLTNTWQRIPGAIKDIGCASTHSVAKMGGHVFWLGSSKEGHAVVYMSEGYGALEISTKPLEQWINAQLTVDDALGFTMQFNGHFIYVISFQTGDRTYCFDLSTRQWFRIAYRDPLTGVQGRHRMNAQAFFNQKNYVGDYALGIVHELSLTTYTDNSNPQVCERYFSHFEDVKETMFWESIEFDIETGVGTTSGQGSDPYIQLRWSDDGGRTYSNWRPVAIGKKGEYNTRAKTNRLGSSRQRVYHIRYSEPTPFSIQEKTIAEVSFGQY